MNTTLKDFVKTVNNEKKYDFLVKEKYLKITDYLGMLVFPFACIRYAKERYIFKGCDISSIVRRSFISDFTNINSLDGYIAYNFVKRLKEKNVKIGNCILWYEGQPSSLGYIQGMRDFYGEVVVKGYIGGSLMEYALQLYPSQYQVERKISPDIIGVIGDGWVETACRFSENLHVESYPSFRFQQMEPSVTNKNSDKHYRIFIVLPYFTDISTQLVEEVLIAVESFKDMEFEIIAKNHPNNAKFSIEDYTVKAKDRIQIVTGDISELSSQSDIVINSMSSSGMEIIANGIFLITYIPKGKLVNVGIPNCVDESRYIIAYTSDDIKKGIKVASSTNRISNLDSCYFFKEVTRESIAQMLN
jgi:hypothetical protein